VSFYSAEELAELGIGRYGEEVLVSRDARIFRPEQLELGSHVRIDAFSIISCGEGGISLGDHVHIGAFAFFSGAGRIEIHDFTGLSSRVSIYSTNDDYSGESLTGPTVPDRYRNVTSAPVMIGKHVIIGGCTIILPGVTVGEGAAIGALSLVSHDIDPFTIWARGKALRERRRDLVALEELVRDEDSATD